MSASTVLCFGEVLWDCLPRGIFAGGAPINVAYHLRRFGLNAIPVTAVGNDFLGDELLRRFHYWNLSPDYASRVDHPTGAVVVDLDDAGVASYKFLDDVAWDHIPLPDALRELAPDTRAIVFGTLAQRSKSNQARLSELRAQTAGARKVYDVNLRPPFDPPELVWELAKDCDLIKLNDDELGTLLGAPVDVSGLEAAARRLGDRTGCSRVCVTAGKRGAGLLWEGAWSFDPPQPIAVKDTVGAGDSFLAALLHGWLEAALTPGKNLRRAARVAEFVASCDGATPDYQLDAEGYPVSR
jgi:fructokinase